VFCSRASVVLLHYLVKWKTVIQRCLAWSCPEGVRCWWA